MSFTVVGFFYQFSVDLSTWKIQYQVNGNVNNLLEIDGVEIETQINKQNSDNSSRWNTEQKFKNVSSMKKKKITIYV